MSFTHLTHQSNPKELTLCRRAITNLENILYQIKYFLFCYLNFYDELKRSFILFHVLLCAFPSPCTAHASSLPPSERRLAANRANAQFSTGPRSDTGKAISSRNAVKTGLTGRTILLPTEDAEAYEIHLLQYVESFAPVGARETELV